MRLTLCLSTTSPSTCSSQELERHRDAAGEINVTPALLAVDPVYDGSREPDPVQERRVAEIPDENLLDEVKRLGSTYSYLLPARRNNVDLARAACKADIHNYAFIPPHLREGILTDTETAEYAKKQPFINISRHLIGDALPWRR